MTAARYKKRLGQPLPRVVRFPATWLAAALLLAAAAVAAVLVLLSPRTGTSAGSVVLAAGIAFGVLVPVSYLIEWTAKRRALLADAAAAWPGKRALLITSASPNWSERIAREWLPRLEDGVVVLDYSRRREREGSLELKLWEAFCKDRRDCVPAVIVFRAGEVAVYGFYRWFDAARRGMPEGLAQLEAHLFAEVGGPREESEAPPPNLGGSVSPARKRSFRDWWFIG